MNLRPRQSKTIVDHQLASRFVKKQKYLGLMLPHLAARAATSQGHRGGTSRKEHPADR
jgi:hypothetical protein